MLEQAERRRIQLATRSQLATELLLTCYAAVGSVILLRTVLVVLGVSDRVWIGSFVYGLLAPVVRVLEFLPGAHREYFANLSTIDLTLIGLMLLFLLGILATGREHT